jgi:peptide-N4-(N-acetyl-beta-glucosaminyl)asparagine amidase
MLTSRRPEHDNFGFKLDNDDILALNLVRWFKEMFMRWVDPIVCPECSGPTEFSSTLTGEEVGEEDQRYGAGRVEMHKCKADEQHPVRRFPRYK